MANQFRDHPLEEKKIWKVKDFVVHSKGDNILPESKKKVHNIKQLFIAYINWSCNWHQGAQVVNHPYTFQSCLPESFRDCPFQGTRVSGLLCKI